MSSKKLYFAYIRVSTVRQGQLGTSLAEQRAAIERHARQKNLKIIKEFQEQETAAKGGRPVFRALMQALREKKATGVIMHKIDRGARNLKDWAELGELIDAGIEVHFANENVDMYSRGGRLSADIQAVVAADYIRNLREEVKKGFYGRIRQGYYPMPAPIGYLDQGGGKVKVLDPASAPLIRRTFELYASGQFSVAALVIRMRQLGGMNRSSPRNCLIRCRKYCFRKLVRMSITVCFKKRSYFANCLSARTAIIT
ncbi:MAG: recombinase family protein [Acidobacteria bacterium]|nr:recombinase family protein [Acidobacteriota bacterium]